MHDSSPEPGRGSKVKTPRIYSDLRKSGIKLIGDLPWGSHICQFYTTQQDLLEILVPYFRAGLASNECCLWIIPAELSVEDATKALKKKLRGFDSFVDKGRIVILSHSKWHCMGERFEKAIVSMLDKAVLSGFEGLRLACHAAHRPTSKNQPGVHISTDLSRFNVIALFGYPRNRVDAPGLMQVVNRHRYALVRNAGKWEVIESSEARIVKEALHRSEQALQSLFHNMSEGFAYHRIVLDAGGKPVDYIFLEANEAFERLTGLDVKAVVGKKATEVLPGIDSDSTDWIGRYGKVALTGKPSQFESHSEQLNRWYSVSAFSPYKGFFAVTFSDITERKLADQAIRKHSAVVEGINRILSAALSCKTEEDLGSVCLNVAQELTGSPFGFIGQTNAGGLENIAVSDPGGDARKIGTSWRPGRTSLNGTDYGIYGRVIKDGKALFINKPARRSGIGLPDGHPPLESFLGAPLIHEDQIIGLLALGDREGGYSITEQQTLEALAPSIVEAFMRHRAERQLRQAHHELDLKVRERTEELHKVNSTLRMTSECNQILVHAADEKQLTSQICKIIVEMGGYRMAWVGYAEHDEQKTVRPVAVMGSEQGYIESARISWADVPHGRGPTGRCIRTGKTELGRSFAEASELAPWRDEALKRGFQSSIALPLMSGEKCFGSLTIYSSLPNDFDESQALLRELADDLAFGIMNIRARTERDQARQAAEKRAEQLQALTMELTQAEQKERRQLARILHDHLQQILVGAKFGASLIRAKAKGNKEIEQTAEELIETIDESIRASRSLSADLSPPVLHEKGLAAGLKWLGRQMQEKHGLTVEITTDEAAEPAAEQIRQFLFDAVRELLLNAVKYAQVNRAEVKMRMLKTGEVEISVADGGVGFNPTKLEASSSTTGGFGLFSIRERLSYLSGRMIIDSAPGQGSRFVLIVPAGLAAPAPESGQIHRQTPGTDVPMEAHISEGNIISVLLADDHPVLRHGLTKLLQEQPDIRVVGEVGDGEAAVDCARQLHPDVVLMDVSLPLINGFEATRQIVSECPGVRVIGLSMHEEPEMAATMFNAGASAYLTKGGPIEHLIAAIRECRKSFIQRSDAAAT